MPETEGKKERAAREIVLSDLYIGYVIAHHSKGGVRDHPGVKAKHRCQACTLFPENMLPHVYYSSEGALKSAAYNLKESMVRVTSVKAAEKGERHWSLSARSGRIRLFDGLICFDISFCIG